LNEEELYLTWSLRELKRVISSILSCEDYSNVLFLLMNCEGLFI